MNLRSVTSLYAPSERLPPIARDRDHSEIRRERIARLASELPPAYAPYTDTYFLRTLEILQRERLNPDCRIQISIRKGPGEVRGVDAALAVIQRYSPLVENGGRVFALKDGEGYAAKEPLLMIEGKLQDVVALETMYLGVLSQATTCANDGHDCVDRSLVKERMAKVVALAGDRPVIYMGARHWHFAEDAAIARAAFDGGAKETSTDSGAAVVGKRGVGTTPHILENAFATVYGRDLAVLASTLAFDRHIDPQVPRVALVDYNNREIRDALAVAAALRERLQGVRIDTCGENVMEGALRSADDPAASRWREAGVDLPAADEPEAQYWYGTGVTISGVYAVRKALDEAGFSHVRIVLSSGFGDAAKVQAFVNAEKRLGVRLFDALGVGKLFPTRDSKAEFVGWKPEGEAEYQSLAKVGRGYRHNPRLQLVLGK